MILLDTCTILWLARGELPSSLRNTLETGPWCASSLSAWEIGIKSALGKVEIPLPLEQWWPQILNHFQIQEIAFGSAEAILASALPPHHLDPFDRGIIATALSRQIPVATTDRRFLVYASNGLTTQGC
ncbi:MAG: type II toxin-antitoxin system VapC family toxin [Fibrobacteres bacterium]|nr:type II toxin-antitoxin system VapC family toxin [Fibrobacterota bacterium]